MQRRITGHLLPIAVLASAWCAVTYAQEATSKPSFVSRVEQLLLHEAGSDGRFNDRLEAAFYGVTAADSIQQLSSVEAPSVCALASQAIKDDVALQDTYYASHILSRLSCQNSQAAKRAAAIALETLQHADSVEAAYQSISILSNLHRSKQLDQAVPAALIERVLSFFKDLMDSSGIFKSSKSSPQRSILATGLVYQALAEARGLEVALSASCESAVDDIRASLPQVLQGGKDGQAVLFLPGEEDQAEAAAQLVIGAAAIYDESFSSITASSLTGAAQLFSGAQHVHSLADATQVGPALQALTQSALPHPLHASLATPGIGLDHQEALVLTVRDAWGQPVPAGAISLQVSLRDAAQQQPMSHKLQHGAATGEFLYDVAASSLKPGSYLLRAVIEDAAGSSAGQSDLSLTISGELQNASLTLAFTEGESEDASNETLHYPMTLSTTTATLDPSQVLKASLVVQGLNPHQRMLRLASKLTGAAAYFSLKPSRVKDETYTVTITSNSIDKQIGSQAGDFDMELLIGDKKIGTPVRWHLATVAVSYQANEDGPQSALPSALADVQKQFQPKPEIVHIQRAPGKSPPKAISLLFTIFSLLPLLCLFYTLELAGANLKGFPTSGPSFIAAVAFHGGMASILTLYTMFWLRLNLMQTLPPLLVLGLFTTVAGYNALSRQAEARLKQQ